MPRMITAFAVSWTLLAPTSRAVDEALPGGQQQTADAQPLDPLQPRIDVDVQPKRPSLLKRRLHKFFEDDDSASTRGVHWGPFAPRMDVVSSGSGIGPTLHFWLPDIGNSPISFHASAHYSILKYQYYDVQLGLVPHEGEHLPRAEKGTTALFPLADIEKTSTVPGFNIYASARYRDYPREDFYGVGASSTIAGHSDYGLQDGLYEGVVRFRVSRLSFMGRAGLLQTSIRPGTDSAFPSTETLNDESTAPGLVRAPDFVHVSVGTWLEWRDQTENPHRGIALGAAFSRFDDRGGNAFRFNRFVAEAREYIPLGSNRHVLAFREASTIDHPDDGSSVPFYMQAVLGGGTYLRGFSSYRFRDNNFLALTAEYRFELRPKIELALIYDSGEVFHKTELFALGSMRNSWGAGLRLKSPHKVRFLLDVLHSTEGTRVIARFRPSF
jgi:Omp85 superfamily domain